VEPLSTHQPSPLAQPVQPVPPADGVVDPLRGHSPWERRQPQVDRRSVIPVEWFRRMPGGATTYAVPGAEVPVVVDGDESEG
jgi:hypothetical protein